MQDLLFLIFIVALIGGPIALSRVVISKRQEAVDSIRQLRLPEGAEERTLQRVRLALGNQKGIEVVPNFDGSLAIQGRFIPVWAGVIAIVLFPIGLFALLARTRHTATLVASEGRVVISGRALTRSSDFYRRVIPPLRKELGFL